MIKIEKLTLNSLDILINYFFQNQSQIEKVISDFGEVSNKNGYGTTFVKPKNHLFSTFWIFEENSKIKTVGLGGPNLGLTLKELYSVYPCYTEGFVPYDDEYVYIFFKSAKYNHTLRITSKEKIMYNNRVISDMDINRIQLSFYDASDLNK
ncbi:hypothetical protein ACPPVU_23440 [Mucilaginibacter sp. McL0603]|uniref:hypothetical protein n=1 Tax=Mucilaginibacter sp. McL0603 TaxID=3415670 RepID=UPI003CEE4531